MKQAQFNDVDVTKAMAWAEKNAREWYVMALAAVSASLWEAGVAHGVIATLYTQEQARKARKVKP